MPRVYDRCSAFAAAFLLAASISLGAAPFGAPLGCEYDAERGRIQPTAPVAEAVSRTAEVVTTAGDMAKTAAGVIDRTPIVRDLPPARAAVSLLEAFAAACAGIGAVLAGVAALRKPKPSNDTGGNG